MSVKEATLKLPCAILMQETISHFCQIATHSWKRFDKLFELMVQVLDSEGVTDTFPQAVAYLGA
jgi:hypothetical protein